MVFFADLEKKKLICMETQKTTNSKSNLAREKCNQRNQAPWLHTNNKATALKTVWHWYKNRNMAQWNRIESPGINPHTYGYWVYDRGGKNIQWRKERLFNKWCLDNLTTTCKRKKLEYYLTHYTNGLKTQIQDQILKNS